MRPNMTRPAKAASPIRVCLIQTDPVPKAGATLHLAALGPGVVCDHPRFGRQTGGGGGWCRYPSDKRENRKLMIFSPQAVIDDSVDQPNRTFLVLAEHASGQRHAIDFQFFDESREYSLSPRSFTHSDIPQRNSAVFVKVWPRQHTTDHLAGGNSDPRLSAFAAFHNYVFHGFLSALRIEPDVSSLKIAVRYSSEFDFSVIARPQTARAIVVYHANANGACDIGYIVRP
jgi:hypothetical protein